jgi:hypothetical protein
MGKREVLMATTFGQTVAEQEVADLTSYFVETDEWRRIYAGDVDIVYGAKGAGKSAIYALLHSRVSELFDRGVIAIAAENPRGALVFEGLVADPPTSETEFRNLWKLYLLLLVAQALRDYGIAPAISKDIIQPVEAANLLPKVSSLGGLLRSALEYVRSLMSAESVEGGIKIDPATSLPVGVSGRITFREPTGNQQKAGLVSADRLLAIADGALHEAGVRIWLLLDRLDVAFAESLDLERNALRALFRVYLDLAAFDSISLKIFLRTDIWDQITKEGFREASHITKRVTLSWNSASLLNLVIRRAMHNLALRQYYGVDDGAVLASAEQQHQLFYKIFPDQVDAGLRKPETLDWMLNRTCDGTTRNAPRELIPLLSASRDEQLKRLELGSAEPPNQWLFDRTSLKEALIVVSRVRFDQTLCAEFPNLKPPLLQLKGEKTLQTPDTLSKIWGMDEKSTAELANQLVEVGFFELRGSKEAPEFWVPFLYRSVLDMVQGTAE